MKDDVTPRERESYKDSNSGGKIWNNPITRRRFLKRTGGATTATALMFSAGLQQAKAQYPCPYGYTNRLVKKQLEAECELTSWSITSGNLNMDDLADQFELLHAPSNGDPAAIAIIPVPKITEIPGSKVYQCIDSTKLLSSPAFNHENLNASHVTRLTKVVNSVTQYKYTIKYTVTVTYTWY